MYYYVYKITDLKRNKFYIGSRSSYVLPEEDLGHQYFSSSTNKKFLYEQQEYPHQFKYDVLKTFPTRKEASKYEAKVLKEIDAIHNKDYINGFTSIGFSKVESRATRSTLTYLGNLIKLSRKERGIAQEELAERVGVSRGVIQRIEAGNSKVSIGSVFEACFVLGIPLLGGDKEHINNLTRMLSYLNALIPCNLPSKNIDFNDDF